MSDPERLLSSSGGQHELERALLDSLRVVSVPAQAKGLIWGALSVTVAEAGALASTAAGTGMASAWRGALKLLASPKALAGVSVMLAALGAGAVRQHSRSAPAVAPPVSPKIALTQAAPEPSPAPSVEAAQPLPVVDAAERPAPALTIRDRLRQESALLTRARAELRAGDAHAAQATLARMQRELGSGGLHQERDVLAIEAWAAEGNAQAAERGAQAFIAAHPESPHAAALRRFLTSH